MSFPLCINCFGIKGDYAVCPYCGYEEGTTPQAAFQLAPGTILAERYIVGEMIGHGGFGVIYRGYDTTLSHVVAIKEFYPASLANRVIGEKKVSVFSGNKAEEYKENMARFIAEAKSMALFSKENDIVNVATFFEENNTAYIVMEYIEGLLLKTQLKQNGRLTQEQARDYTVAILRALKKIHDQGIVHRDISPDNIFLTGKDTVKLLDFGAAKLSDDDKNTARVVKTGYAPPEQYRSADKQDRRMDLYAAGAVMYQMLTGEKPMESLERMENDLLSKPSVLGVKIDAEVEVALMQALALRPDDRFASAQEFEDALLGKNSKPEKKKGWKWW